MVVAYMEDEMPLENYQIKQKKLVIYGTSSIICGFILTMFCLVFGIESQDIRFLWFLVISIPSIFSGIVCFIAENYLEDKYNPLGKRSLTRKISNLEPVYLASLEQEKLEAAWNLLKPKEKQ